MYISFAIRSHALGMIFVLAMPFVLILPKVFAQDSELISLLVLMFTELLSIAIVCLFVGDGSKIVKIDKKGISNRRVKLCWDAVRGAKAVDIDAKRYKRIHGNKDIDIACFSLEPEEGDYYSIDRKRVVMIQMNKKTYRVLNKYARGKSEAVDRFLDSVDWYKYRD